MGRRVGVLVSAMMLFAASCGGSSDDPADQAGGADGIPNNAPTVSRTVTSVAATASVEQVASAMASQVSGVQEAIANIDGCFFLDDPSCSDITLGLDYYSLQLTAQTLSLTMTGVTNPDSLTFQGAVPTELEQLYDQTIEESDTLEQALKDFDAAGCSTDRSGPQCLELNVAVHTYADQLSSTVDAWAPYL